MSILQFLWKQKYRVDKGYQLVSLVNLGLLLSQSEVLKGYLGISTTTLIILGMPLALLSVWSFGYIMSCPMAQVAEDRANAEVSQMRRDLDEVLRRLRRITNEYNLEVAEKNPRIPKHSSP